MCGVVCTSGNFEKLRKTEKGAKPADNMEPRMNRPAAKVLMKVLYAARMARYDLLKAVCPLAPRSTRWREADTTALHRRM